VLARAIRVARRAVVVKGARYSTDLRKLGLTPLPSTRTADVVWARVDKQGG
jgi:16S rRNA (guanine1516-N2)-methyltransferase